MLTCIGKRKTPRGITFCTATSDQPNDPRWPETYLCPDCANSRSGAPTLFLDLPDLDVPEIEEEEEAEIEQDFFDDDYEDLEEIEL